MAITEEEDRELAAGGIREEAKHNLKEEDTFQADLEEHRNLATGAKARTAVEEVASNSKGEPCWEEACSEVAACSGVETCWAHLPWEAVPRR